MEYFVAGKDVKMVVAVSDDNPKCLEERGVNVLSKSIGPIRSS